MNSSVQMNPLDDIEPVRVPSRPDFKPKEAPWNTVGLPEPNNVRRAVREIESRLQERRKEEHILFDSFEDSHKSEEEVVNTNEVARTRLLWKARERGVEPRKSVEYRTDYYPGKEERGENVIVLKLEEVPTVEKKDANVQTINTETIETIKVESYFNYEKSWRDFRSILWEYKNGPISTVNSDKVSSIDSQIPRARTSRICKTCRKIVLGDKKCCEKVESRESESKFLVADPQRSRTNFFGNSGSYALRCNLFAVPQKQPTGLRRKFYMTPEPKKVEKPKYENTFETFQAKKRVFYKQRLTRMADGVHYSHMW